MGLVLKCNAKSGKAKGHDDQAWDQGSEAHLWNEHAAIALYPPLDPLGAHRQIRWQDVLAK